MTAPAPAPCAVQFSAVVQCCDRDNDGEGDGDGDGDGDGNKKSMSNKELYFYGIGSTICTVQTRPGDLVMPDPIG